MKSEESAFLRIEKGRVEGYRESEMIPLSPDVTIIGRPPTKKEVDFQMPDIKIGDDFVSRGHIKIYYSHSGKSYMLEERKAGTPNHSFINEKQIEPDKAYPLTDGDEIGMAKVHGQYRVVFRFRKSGESGIETLPGFNEIGDPAEKGLKIDIGARIVWLDGKEIHLRKKEFDLIAYLYQKQGKACSREEIAMNVWKGKDGEQDGIISEETIDTTVHRIREAIESDPLTPKYIKTIRNYGFRLDL